MKTTAMPILAAVLSLGVIATSPAQEQVQHRSHNEMHATDELDLRKPDSGKWASDESLRQGMSELQAAFEPHHAAYRKDDFDSGRAADLADTVEEKVNFMFANCHLPADTDAELHKLLAAALGAARSLRESDDPHEGLHRLHRVLQAYPEHFDHPGWSG